eukprot:g8353.t1
MMLANVTSDVLSQLERFKESFLWAAAKGGRVEECESLVQMGSDVNWVSPEGDTPLLAACRHGHGSAALYLLNHGASVNQAAKDGQTALHLCCRHGQEAVAEALILRGADVFARDNSGTTAFESEGPHAPVGMLRRLNDIALRTSRRNRHHHHDDVSVEATATAAGDGTPDSASRSTRSNNNSSDAEAHRAPDNRGRPGSNETNASMWRRGSTGYQRGYHPAGDAHDGAGGVSSAAMSTGHDTRTTTASWNAGAGGGGGHGTVPSASATTTTSNSSNSSSSNSSRNSNNNSNNGSGGPENGNSGPSSRRGSGSDSGAGGGGSDPGAPATSISTTITPRHTQTPTQMGATTAAGRPGGHGESAAGLGRGHAQQWAGAGIGSGSGRALCPTTAATPFSGSRMSASGRGMVAGGIGYDGGCGEGLVEGCQAPNDHVGLIRVLWLQEKESRLASEAKAEAIRDQSARVWNELVRSEKQVLSLEEEMASLREERDKLKVTLSGTGFKGRSLPELEQLEKELRKALEGVCGERDRIVQEQLAKEEQRLCVVCQDKRTQDCIMAPAVTRKSRVGGRRQRPSIAATAAVAVCSFQSCSQAFVVPTASSRAVSGAFTPSVNSRTPESGTVARRRMRAAPRMVAAETEAAPTTTGPSPIGGPLRVGMFGGGTVGGGVYEICEQDKKVFLQGLGCDSEIVKICVRDSKKPRDFKMASKTELVTDYDAILNDDSINCVVELMGGVTDAKDVVFGAIRRNKHVVTANKALVAAYMGEIQQLLQEHPGVTFGYEAAVCGGIPIIATLQHDYPGDKILKVCGIMNGTTNFMLSKMESEGADYGEVLKEAQDLGYAEADPTADVEGFDVQAKIALLTKLAFGATVPSESIQCKGISSLTSVDFEYAKMMRSTIKLLGTAMLSDDGAKLSVFVSPVLVPLKHPIASARGPGNIVSVDSKNMGTASFAGPGAGRYPTANSVVNDIVRLGTGKVGSPFPFDKEWELETDFTAGFYLRITCQDDLGIIKRVGELAAENGVSIHAILQNPIEDVANVDFVVTTDPCKQSQVDLLSKCIGEEKWAKGVPLVMSLL